ncbi:lectin-like isoform X1 [Amborella trichopoda]|uniref:lectin-like isoform X1 n=1 Tax=Amborella trichopoda TaxID=13333 RepID=UPI0009BCB04A|nr:lectin-like isoform X1 [Amborella trichopoda]|eukprot:XP_020528368.1 lectin-like isoform X1 [Amborella trichopoda]
MGGKSSTPRRSPIPSTEPLHYTLLAATLPKKKFDPFAEMNNGSKVENLRYWVYEESRGNYFILFARELKIVWGEDGRYWRWIRLPESSHPEIEMAELLKVCWFEVRGKIDASCLSPGMDNIVAFIV